MQQLIQQLNFHMLIVRMAPSEDIAATAPHIIQINQAAAALLGYQQQQLIGQPLAKIFAGLQELQLWQNTISTLYQHNANNYFEGDLINQKQQRVHALLSVSPLPSKQADVIDTVLLIQTIKPDNDLFTMRRVVEQSASAVMITDRNGKIEYVNPKFTELTGYSAAELLGQNPKMLQSGSMPAAHYQAMWNTLLNTGEWQGEIENKKKNGDLYWAYESVSAIKNNDGDITHYLAVEENITHRKEIESALTESEERFRQMAEMTGEWLWEQDPNGYYLYSSNAVKQILGYPQEQIIGKHYTEFLTAQDKENQQGFTSSHQSFYALVNHYQHKDGQEILTESTGLPIINAQGKLVKWRGVDRDITARMHFQNALIDSEKRTRLIIESSINAIVIMDSYGIIIDWNHRAEKMFGWSATEAIGQRLAALIIPPRFHEAHRLGLSKFLQSGAGPILNRQTEQTAINRAGVEFPVELSVSPLKLGNAYIFSGFIHDISSRKAAEQQIRQAQINLAIAQNEIKIAQQIQATLSPSAPIKSADFEITGVCLPANRVGGDYFDYFFRSDSQLDIVIADVSGHSIGPALFMVETRSAIRAQTNVTATPAQTLDVLNSFLFTDLDKSDYFITLFYGQYDLKQQQLRFANAGHPPPLLLRIGRGDYQELDAEGLILGVRKHVDFEEKSLVLAKGDVLLFYTDGLIEAVNSGQEFFGLDRVKEIFSSHAQQSPQTIIDALYAALQTFCGRAVFDDDITLMILKCD
ncbi:MAG: PAS domain S-box protein [Methylococcales bacterium]